MFREKINYFKPKTKHSTLESSRGRIYSLTIPMIQRITWSTSQSKLCFISEQQKYTEWRKWKIYFFIAIVSADAFWLKTYGECISYLYLKETKREIREKKKLFFDFAFVSSFNIRFVCAVILFLIHFACVSAFFGAPLIIAHIWMYKII